MGSLHSYSVAVTWTGAGDAGTSGYTAYSRDHTVQVVGKPDILASSDPAFRGEAGRHNPEELFVASLAECHMLWFLHVAAAAGVVVTAYEDRAVGTMRVEAAGAGQFTGVELRPRVTVTVDGTLDPASAVADLHARAHDHCFISRSVHFPVHVSPVVHVAARTPRPA